MMITKKFILTGEELREIIMTAWVNGWYEKETCNDDNKRKYADKVICELI